MAQFRRDSADNGWWWITSVLQRRQAGDRLILVGSGKATLATKSRQIWSLESVFTNRVWEVTLHMLNFWKTWNSTLQSWIHIGQTILVLHNRTLSQPNTYGNVRFAYDPFQFTHNKHSITWPPGCYGYTSYMYVWPWLDSGNPYSGVCLSCFYHCKSFANDHKSKSN